MIGTKWLLQVGRQNGGEKKGFLAIIFQNLVRRKNVTEPESPDDLIIKIGANLISFPSRLVVDFSFNFLT